MARRPIAQATIAKYDIMGLLFVDIDITHDCLDCSSVRFVGVAYIY